MDEVDKIIVHSLEQIGCKTVYQDINDDKEVERIFRLKQFTPDLLVQAVSKCLKEIKSDDKERSSLSIEPPQSLPENMAQRFTVATNLAQMCKTIGYISDIGYQTFLYPNEMETRRLLMFLIEHLPKHSKENLYQGPDENALEGSLLEQLLKKSKQIISKELKSLWIPPCAKKEPINVAFRPQLSISKYKMHKLSHSGQKMEFYQQNHQHQNLLINSGDYKLICTLLHHNALFNYDNHIIGLNDLTKLSSLSLANRDNLEMTYTNRNLQHLENKSKSQLKSNNLCTQNEIIQQIELLNEQNEKLINKRRGTFKKLNLLQQRNKETIDNIEELSKDVKNHQRICTIIENVEENMIKLESLVEKTQNRRITLESQWHQHRVLALKRLEELRTLKQTKNLHIIEELREKIQSLQNDLNEKNSRYLHLAKELKTNKEASISTKKATILQRHDYTQRIHEFIGNIRKQRNDINKVLDDTKQLQKHLNILEGQLQRQFNYTDDLLFQGAKHDVYAKQAYKILATLHESCKDIYKLIEQTGQRVKEIREQELQIDREYAKNTSGNLQQISSDIINMQNYIEIMSTEIDSLCHQEH